MHTNLPQIKSGKPKSIKKTKNIETKNENSFTEGTIKLFFPIFFQMFTYHPVEGAQHQLNKTDELGINGPIS